LRNLEHIHRSHKLTGAARCKSRHQISTRLIVALFLSAITANFAVAQQVVINSRDAKPWASAQNQGHAHSQKHEFAPAPDPSAPGGGDPVYTATNTTTDLWSAGTHWSATPTSGATTQLTYNGGSPYSGITNTNTDNISGAFSLNILDLSGSEAATGGASSITIAASVGSSLNFVSNGATTPVINLTGNTGNNAGNGMVYTVSAPITLTNNTLFTGNGTATFNFSGIISGASAVSLTKSGTSTLTLGGANAFAGVLTVQAGTLSIATINNASTAGVLGNSANAVVLGGSGTTGTLEYTGGSALSNKAFMMATGGTGAFQIDTAGTTLTLSGGINGSGGLTKTGAGTLALSDINNTYGGSTTINGGTLALQFPGGNSKNNVLPSGTQVTFGGGALTVTEGNKADTQTLGNLTFSSGANAITLTGNGSDTFILTAGNTWTRSVGSTLNITLNSQTFTSSPTVANSIVVGSGGTAFATVAGANWATVSGGNIAALGTYQTGTSPGGWATTDNVSLAGNPSANVGNQSINSLRLAGTSTVTIGGGNTLTLSSGGLLATGSGANTITGGTLTGASGKDLIVHQYSSGNLTISSVIADNTSATGLTKSGTGTLILTGNNTYTGTTFINAGTLNADATGGNKALGATTNIVVNSGGTLLTTTDQQFNATAPPTMTLAGGKLNTGGTSQTLGALTLTNSSVIDLGAGASILQFAASGGATWTPSKILEIDNWSGTTTGGGTDQLLFGTTSSGLAASQIAEIQFLNPAGFSAGTYGAMILANGEVVPIPEASTWLAAGLALGVIGFMQGRRRSLVLFSSTQD
jgi:autotransporter-associated beta strand protein